MARAQYIQGLFARIARRYDLMNRLMTCGQDMRWRREVIRLAQLPPGAKLLDIGTGTGDLALEALRREPRLTAVGADFTLEMMRVAQRRPGATAVNWAGTDALALPFPADTFDAVTTGFLMRNVTDLERACSEQFRVLKPGGRVVCLDTAPPDRGVSPILWPLIRFYLRTVIPVLGRIISGESDPYQYRPKSTASFLSPPALAERWVRAGFLEVQHKRLMFGTVAIHWGRK